MTIDELDQAPQYGIEASTSAEREAPNNRGRVRDGREAQLFPMGTCAFSQQYGTLN